MDHDVKEIRIAVVEDDVLDMQSVLQALERFLVEAQIRYHISTFTDGEDLTEGYRAEYDLILLDIEMAFQNGMKTAAKVREMDERVLIIFITNNPQYAIEGYKVGALDYILKPISYFTFSQSLRRAVKNIRQDDHKYLSVAVKGGKQKIDLNELCYIEVQDHDILYHTTSRIFTAKGTMREVEQQLDPKLFFRCNRCYIVSLKYVQKYEGTFAAVAGDQIQISRSRKKPFLDALNQYLSQ